MTFALVVAAAVAACLLGALTWALGRHLLGRVRAEQFERRVSRVRAALAESRAAGYAGLDKLLFDMREAHDQELLREGLQTELQMSAGGDSDRRASLARAFDMLGLTERYLGELRDARAWEARARAATTLGMLGEPRATRPLLAGMRDSREDADVKLACAEALAQIRDPAIIPDLCDELADVHEWSSPRLAQVLTEFGAAAAPHLLAVLDRADGLNARIWAAQVLGSIGDPRAVVPLIARLTDRSEQLRLSACNALGRIEDGRAVHPLVDVVLADGSGAVRAQAAAALGRIGDGDALPVLIHALEDLEYWTRLRALAAIEQLAPDDTTPLEHALLDPRDEVRRRAALALERLGVVEAAFDAVRSTDGATADAARARLVAVGRAGLSERLVHHLRYGERATRAQVARALGEVGNLDHGPALVKALDDDALEVRTGAISALGELGAPGTARELMRFLDSRAPTERRAAIDALRRYPPDQLEQLVVDLAERGDSPSDEARAAVVEVFVAVPGARAVDLLARATDDRYGPVRLTAIRALEHRGDRTHVDSIGPSLSDPDPHIRAAAATALGCLGGADAISLLSTAAAAAHSPERGAFCDALARLGFDAVAPTFDVLLASDDDSVRLDVVLALGRAARTDDRALTMLAMMLHEPTATLRAHVARALAHIPGAPAHALVAALPDPDADVRAAVVDALACIGTVDHVAAVAGLVDDPVAAVRQRAVLAVARIGGESAYSTIASAAAAGGVDSATSAVAFGVCGSPDGVASAAAAMADPDVRARVVELLAADRTGIPTVFLGNVDVGNDNLLADRLDEAWPERLASVEAAYTDALRNNASIDARCKAAAGLAQLSSDDALGALADALRSDPAPSVRMRAARALAEASDRQPACDALAAATRDPVPTVRVIAIDATAAVDSNVDPAPLFESLKSTDADVARAARDALAAMHETRVDALHEWIEAQTSDPAIAAGLRVVTAIGDPASRKLVVDNLESASPQVRREAATYIAAQPGPGPAEAIARALKDPAADVRVAVVNALARGPRADAAALLGTVRHDPSANVRERLADVLADIAGDAAIELLEQLARDIEPQVSARASLALLRPGDSDGQARFLAVWSDLPVAAKHRVIADADAVVDEVERQLLHAPRPARRRRALDVLLALGARANAPRIAGALEDADASVRLAAVEALCQVDGAEAQALLELVRHDPVVEIRSAVRPRKLI